MTAVDESRRSAWRSARWRSPTLVAMLLLCVAVIGWNVGARYGTNEPDFYATVSQVIATLFIAIFLESFTNEHPLWKDGLDRVLVLGLLVSGLLGLFACVRGLLQHGNSLTTGLAAAGLVSCLLLVALALIRRIRAFARPSSTTVPPLIIMLIFVATAMVALVYVP